MTPADRGILPAECRPAKDIAVTLPRPCDGVLRAGAQAVGVLNILIPVHSGITDKEATTA